MKTKNLLLALVAILALASCDKDNDPGLTKNSHRVKQIIFDTEGYNNDWKYVFTYEGEKMASFLEYNRDESGNWYEKLKTDVSYAGDNATVTCYEKDSGSWKITDKHEYVIQSGLMMEELNYDYENGAWIKASKWTYQYSGTNISAWQSYDDEDEDGTFEQNGKGEYIYKNGKITDYKEYKLGESDNFYLNSRETFDYNGSKMISFIDYNLDESDSLINASQTEYHYSGDKVSETEYSNWNSDKNQWDSEYLKSFIYNSNGYLIEEIFDDSDKVTYEYEEGHGNAKFFFYYPEASIYREPTLRNAGTTKNRKYIPYYQRLKNI